MITRPVGTGTHKARVSSGIRKLAAEVNETFPEMKLEGHLRDAARELDAGRMHSAQRHLNAAIFGLQPQQVRRHGIHDDGGHEHAKQLMQQAYRHLLNVKDIEDMSTGNEELAQRRRDAIMNAQQQRAFLPSSQPAPVGNPNGNAGPVASPMAVAPQARGLKALANGPQPYRRGEDETVTCPYCGKGDAPDAIYCDQCGRKLPDSAFADLAWGTVMNAIELGTFAGKPPGSGKNFAKLKGSLAKRGARNPGALAAWIGRRKYGRKGFAKLGHAHANQAGGIELVGPKGYIHGWIKASVQALGRSGGGAYLPDHPGFGHMTRPEHRRAAAGHLAMMKKAPAGSQKASMHHKFAKLHAAAAMGREMQRSGYAIAGSRGSTNAFANGQNGIELVGPKGYVHGWKYVGGPGLPAPKARPGRYFMEGKQVSQHEYQQRMNAVAAGSKGDFNTPGGLKMPFPAAGLPARPPAGPPDNLKPRVRGWVSGAAAAHLHGVHGVYGDLGGGKGVVVGTYDHRRGTITHPHTGKVSKVVAVDASMHEAAFKGDVASSHLPADIKAGLTAYDRAYRSGGVYRNIAKSMGGSFTEMANEGGLPFELSARTAMLQQTPAPYGKPGGPGLYGVKGNKHSDYFEQVVKALMDKRGMDKGQASRIAWGALRKWRRGGGHTHPEVRAAATKALGEEAAAGARARNHTNDWNHGYELTGTAAGAAKDSRTPLGTFGTGGAAQGGKARQRQQLVSKIKLEKQRIAQLKQLIHQLQASQHASAKKRAQATKAAATGKTRSGAPAKRQAAQTTSAGPGKGAAPARAAGPVKPGAKKLTRAQQITAAQNQIARLVSEIKAQQRQLARL